MISTQSIAEALFKDLSKESLENYKLENARKIINEALYGRSTKNYERYLEAANLALKMYENKTN